MPAGGPNSFIFMQFSATKLKIALLGVGVPLRKILDPPLGNNNTIYSKNRIGNRNFQSKLPIIVFINELN